MKLLVIANLMGNPSWKDTNNSKTLQVSREDADIAARRDVVILPEAEVVAVVGGLVVHSSHNALLLDDNTSQRGRPGVVALVRYLGDGWTLDDLGLDDCDHDVTWHFTLRGRHLCVNKK